MVWDKARKHWGLLVRLRALKLIQCGVSSRTLLWLCGEGVRGQATREEAGAEVAESQGSGTVGAPDIRTDQLC